VVVPLARANTAHAEALLVALAKTPLSTRELRRWFDHYQPSTRAVRERMVSHPRLFLDSLQAEDDRRTGTRLRDGPEGECLADLRCLEAVLARLCKRITALDPLPPALPAALPRLRGAMDALTGAITRKDTHDPDRDPQRGAHLAGTGPQFTRDQPPPGAVAQHRQAYLA
jgi:hypothetical protein